MLRVFVCLCVRRGAHEVCSCVCLYGIQKKMWKSLATPLCVCLCADRFLRLSLVFFMLLTDFPPYSTAYSETEWRQLNYMNSKSSRTSHFIPVSICTSPIELLEKSYCYVHTLRCLQLNAKTNGNFLGIFAVVPISQSVFMFLSALILISFTHMRFMGSTTVFLRTFPLRFLIHGLASARGAHSACASCTWWMNGKFVSGERLIILTFAFTLMPSTHYERLCANVQTVHHKTWLPPTTRCTCRQNTITKHLQRARYAEKKTYQEIVRFRKIEWTSGWEMKQKNDTERFSL